MSDETSVHRLVVDRMEAAFAAVELEGGGIIDLPRWMLPAAARQGDVIRVETAANSHSATVRLHLDPVATDAARVAALQHLRRLSNRDPGGPIDL